MIALQRGVLYQALMTRFDGNPILRSSIFCQDVRVLFSSQSVVVLLSRDLLLHGYDLILHIGLERLALSV